MDNNELSLLDRLFGANAEEVVEKVAEEAVETPEVVEEVVAEEADSMEKVAEDAAALGRFIADGFWERFTEKLAMEMIPAAGAGLTPRSQMEEIAARIGQMKGEQMVPGDDTSVRAEEAAASAGVVRGAAGQTMNAQTSVPKAQG